MAFSNPLSMILLELLFVYFKTCNALSTESQIMCRLRIVTGYIGLVRLLTTNAMLNRIKRCGHIESKDQSCTAPLGSRQKGKRNHEVFTSRGRTRVALLH